PAHACSVDLPVGLSAPGTGTVTVHYATANSSASSGTGCNADYNGVSGTLTFAPGETTKVVPVQLFDCAIVQGFQSFTLGLDTPVNASIARASARVGIVNNDTAATTPYRLFVRDAVVDEKDGSVRVRSEERRVGKECATRCVLDDYTKRGSTTRAGTDYTTAGSAL